MNITQRTIECEHSDFSATINMTKNSEVVDRNKRERIQSHFWNVVGAVEHISLPKLEDAVRKEFKFEDDRSVRVQIELMQTEARIKVQSRVKVWIRQPRTNYE